MTYETLITTISEIVDNENIDKNNLTLVYTLPATLHRKMQETLHYKNQKNGENFTPVDDFELIISGLMVKFLKKVENI